MRWRQGRRSTRIDDRRGRRPARLGRGLPLGGGAILVIVIGAALLGADPGKILALLGGGGQVGGPGSPAAPPSPESNETLDFMSAVLADTEDTWGEIFRQSGQTYEPPVLVVFTDAVESACGFNSAAVGPFYCPPDRQVYLDLTFFQELERRFGAPGDFAQAYVLAHEVGHHIQKLLGISDRVHARRQSLSRTEGNSLSVRQELQADCLAGVWAHHAGRRDLLEPGDLEEGLRAAAAVGDDTIQRRSTGRVSPESWTHGSAEQRMTWFRRGLETGSADACDTFSSSGS